MFYIFMVIIIISIYIYTYLSLPVFWVPPAELLPWLPARIALVGMKSIPRIVRLAFFWTAAPVPVPGAAVSGWLKGPQ